MPTDIAVCPICGSTNIIYIRSYQSDSYAFAFSCECGYVSPERDSLRDADQDINWRPATELRQAA